MAGVWPVHFLAVHLCWILHCWDYLTGVDLARVVDRVVAVHLSHLPLVPSAFTSVWVFRP